MFLLSVRSSMWSLFCHQKCLNSVTNSGRPGSPGRTAGIGSRTEKSQKIGSVTHQLGEKCKSAGIFVKKSGKNMRKSIVLSIPPGRGYQLMP